MLGEEIRYRRGPLYNSAKFFDLEYTTVGFVPAQLDADSNPLPLPADVHGWFQQAPGSAGSSSRGASADHGPGRLESQRILVRGDKVVGFSMLGSRWDHERLLQWIDEERTLEWVLAHLAEAQFDEEFAARWRIRAQALPGE